MGSCLQSLNKDFFKRHCAIECDKINDLEYLCACCNGMGHVYYRSIDCRLDLVCPICRGYGLTSEMF